METVLELGAYAAEVMVLTFTVSTLFAAGLSVGKKNLFEAFHSLRRLGIVLTTSFILVPLLAYGVATLFRLEQANVIGMVIIGLVGGAPIIPKMVLMARADVALSTAMMMALIIVTTFYAPFVLMLLLPDIDVHPLAIAKTQIFSLLLPLFTGLIIHEHYPAISKNLLSFANFASTFSLLMMILLILMLTYETLWEVMGGGAFIATFVFVALAFIAGYSMGGSKRDERIALGVVAAQRNVAAAILIAGLYFEDPHVLATVLVCGLVMMITGILGCSEWGKRVKRTSG